MRSTGGWRHVKAAGEAGEYLKSDERILGDSDFVEKTLKAAEEALSRRHCYAMQGIDLAELIRLTAGIFWLNSTDIRLPGKQPQRVRARSLVCCWAVREMGMTATAVARVFAMTQPAVSQSVKRGARLIEENGWLLECVLAGKL